MNNFVIMAVALLLAAIMIPIGMQQIVATSTTSWNSAVITLWQVLLPVLFIVGLAILFVPRLKGKKGMASLYSIQQMIQNLKDKFVKNKRGTMSAHEIIYVIIGFVLVAIMTPIGMNYLVSINSTFNVSGTASTYSAVYTIFSVLLPVLYIVGVALYFIPKLRS